MSVRRSCSACGATKPVYEFAASATRCKSCAWEALKHRPAKTAVMPEPEPPRRRARRRRQSDDRMLAIRTRVYGITPEQYNDMWFAQGGRCAICRRSEDEIPDGRLHIDHDHGCCPDRRVGCGNCVRGLLCVSCNSAIGMLKDNPEWMRNAAAFIEAGPVTKNRTTNQVNARSPGVTDLL